MAGIQLDGVSKVFDDGTRAVDGVDLEIHDGEFMVLVGPSGCGKSTLLRLVAGLEEVTSGRIVLGDRDVTRALERDRDMAMVFQNYALYPHMSVRDNLAFGLRLRRMPKLERMRKVEEAATMLGLDGLLERKPAALSGGQRQRVAMGRAMVREPAAFLMDEPLSNLDAKLRVAMRAELARLHERLGVTTVYVTHDQVEAMTLGQRVAVMRDGVLQQCAPPEELYDRPANLFVAAFMGSPAMNLVEATVTAEGLRFGDHQLPLPPSALGLPEAATRVILGMRPSDLALAGPDDDSDAARLPVVADVVERLGSERRVIFRVNAPRVATDAVTAASDEPADAGAVLFGDERRSLFTAVLDGRAPVAADDALVLTLAPERMYLFDPATGRALRGPPVAARP
jgi:multiple sugar transport system ATP-binding protein